MTRIKLPYIKEYLDRHGRVRRYFRRRGHRPISLPGDVGSSEFTAAYAMAIDGKVAPSDRHGTGTLGKLAADYFSSVEFSNLKPSSKALYHFAIDPVAIQHGHRLVRDMEHDNARMIVQGIGATRPGMANVVNSVMKRLMKYAIRMGYRNGNPFTGIDTYNIGTHHTWTEAELSAFEARWPLGTRERLAYALLLYTDQRSGDVVRMQRKDIKAGAIRVVQQKTGTELLIPLHQNLLAALKAGPANGLNLIGDLFGRPIKRPTLTKLIRRAARDAGLPDHCVPHGLRKAMLRRLSEAGATTKQIAAISGHRSLKEIERYTAAADQEKLARAAIMKLQPRTKRG